MLDSAEIDDDTAAAIAEVAQTRDGIKIKFHDKLGALEKIGKHLGMFVDRHEHSGKDGGPIETRELSPLEAARRLAFAWEKGIRALEEKSE
jgi:phage terminase small subunit